MSNNKNNQDTVWFRKKENMEKIIVSIIIGAGSLYIWKSTNFQFIIDNRPFIATVYILLIIIIALFFRGSEPKKSNVTKDTKLRSNSKSRIVILLPISCTAKYENDDLKLIASGLGDGLKDFSMKITDTLNEQYEVIFVDNYIDDNAIDYVKKELELGTRYFISTLSKFSILLSEKFEKLSLDANNKDAVLINTISGSTKIITKENKIYNFYPTSKVEIEALINYSRQHKLSKPYIFNYNSIYTKECKNELINKWNEKYDSKHSISERNNAYEFSLVRCEDNTLHPNFHSNQVSNADSIFIFAYGEAFFDILKELKTQNNIELTKKTILTLSTFRHKDWDLEEKKILADLKIVTIRPKMKNKKPFKTDKDIVTYFSEQTFDRLLNSLEILNHNNNILSFDEAWKKSVPKLLKFNADNTVSVNSIQLVL